MDQGRLHLRVAVGRDMISVAPDPEMGQLQSTYANLLLSEAKQHGRIVMGRWKNPTKADDWINMYAFADDTKAEDVMARWDALEQVSRAQELLHEQVPPLAVTELSAMRAHAEAMEQRAAQVEAEVRSLRIANLALQAQKNEDAFWADYEPENPAEDLLHEQLTRSLADVESYRKALQVLASDRDE